MKIGVARATMSLAEAGMSGASGSPQGRKRFVANQMGTAAFWKGSKERILQR